MTPTEPVSPKLLQFNQELEALCKKYLYDLRVKILYTDAGISGQIVALDTVPQVPQVVPPTPPVTPATPTPEVTKTDEEKATA